MIAALLGFLRKLLGLLLARRGPSPEAEAAARASAAETELTIKEHADAEAKAAIEAARAVAASDLADPERLREPSDPDCRDCRLRGAVGR